MTQRQQEEDFLADVKRRLDASADHIDELTRARLGAARRRAVEAGSRSRGWRLGDVRVAARGAQLAWLAGGFLLLLVLVIPQLQTPPAATQTVHLLDDMELLGASEDLEFYQDLDFYIWVADEQDQG